jgi:hypothetical protein
MSEAISGEIVDGQGGIYLTIKGEDFECRRVSTTWQMMQYAEARKKSDVHIPDVPKGLPDTDPRMIRKAKAEEQRNIAGMNMLALLLETATVILKPHERERFRAFMDEVSASDEGLDQGELETAISNAISAVGGQGKEADRTSSAPSDGSQNTSENVRVISSNKVTRADGLPMANQFAHDAT